MDKAKRELLQKQAEGLTDDLLLFVVGLPMPWTTIITAAWVVVIFGLGVWVGS